MSTCPPASKAPGPDQSQTLVTYTYKCVKRAISGRSTYQTVVHTRWCRRPQGNKTPGRDDSSPTAPPLSAEWNGEFSIYYLCQRLPSGEADITPARHAYGDHTLQTTVTHLLSVHYLKSAVAEATPRPRPRHFPLRPISLVFCPFLALDHSSLPHPQWLGVHSNSTNPPP